MILSSPPAIASIFLIANSEKLLLVSIFNIIATANNATATIENKTFFFIIFIFVVFWHNVNRFHFMFCVSLLPVPLCLLVFISYPVISARKQFEIICTLFGA